MWPKKSTQDLEKCVERTYRTVCSAFPKSSFGGSINYSYLWCQVIIYRHWCTSSWYHHCVSSAHYAIIILCDDDWHIIHAIIILWWFTDDSVMKTDTSFTELDRHIVMLSSWDTDSVLPRHCRLTRQNITNGTRTGTHNLMLLKRGFCKVEQIFPSACSTHVSRVWVLDLG